MTHSAILPTMRVMMLAGWSCAAAACAHAHAVQSWPELVPRLTRGESVALFDAAGEETRGHVAAVSAESLTLDVRGALRQFDSSDVREVTRNGDPLWNGLAIGAAIGAAAALVPDNVCNRQAQTCDGAQVPQRAALFAAAAALGAAIDALHRDRSVLYRSPVRVRLQLRPAFTASSVGVALVIGSRADKRTHVR
jgi:hypothetical protein